LKAAQSDATLGRNH